MAGKIVTLGSKAQDGIINGVVKASDAIARTLGPSGKAVVIASDFGAPEITRDGATVAKSIEFSDKILDQGAQLVRKAASLTEDEAGDGPQPLYAKILTPTGWTTMGELKIGDKICGTNETIQEVVGIFHKGEKEVYKVSFSNGQVVECCEDHLWTVTDNNGKTKTLPLKSIISEGLVYNKPCGQCQYRFFTPSVKVEFENKDLTIDPYLLGLLLGDGSLSKSGSIELALGEKKIGVLDSIILPDNIKLSSKYYPDHHYYRVKFSAIGNNGKTMHSYIEDVGLIDTNSKTKFIPKNYLYSSKETREKLLLGLLNTDGYVNSRGLIEYSTVSEQLCMDIVELMRGLGMTVTYHIDVNSYSDTPIYRISQLKGYKNGVKMVGIEKTGKKTEMQCIKVSNPDELYITNDYIVTHNTSTTSILVKEFCLKGQKALKTGSNANEIKSGMIKAQKWVTDYITKNSIKVDGDLEKIRKVATISANNDPEVGDLVVQCMEKVGVDGIITADMASGLDTVIDVTTGMKLERGWASPQYVTSPEDGKCVMDDAYIIVVGEKLSSVSQILPIMKPLMETGRPFLFIVDDMDEVVNTTLVVNTLQGAIRCCVVKGIDFGDGRKNTMQDIATAVGATYICPENGIDITDAKLENFGAAKKVIISRDNTIIYEGCGDPTKIKERVDILKKRLEDPTISNYDKSKFEKRIANLSGGIGIIKAGGATEVEKQNRKATIEDAILASKSAIAEGCAAGGGYIYYKASLEAQKDTAFWKSLAGDEKEGAEIVFSSLPVILKTVANNSGVSGDVILADLKKTKKENWGYNAKTKKYCSLVDDGILDSAKVLRVALENSISTASMILLTDCIIYDEPTEKTESGKIGF